MNRMKMGICVIAILLVAGLYFLTTQEEAPSSPAPQTEEQPSALNASTVSLLFATNRKVEGEGCKYGADRADKNALSYGSCLVSIPKDHRLGQIESPAWYEREDPNEHVVILAGEILSKAKFDEHLSKALSETGASLVFVHGFNVPFEDAAKRTAQMAYDLKFKGAPLFFSWPSAGDPKSYPADEAAVEWSYPAMYSFLKDHLENENVKNTYLIAHSMGNRALTAAIVRLRAERPDLSVKLKEVVLAAPDIDSGTFMDSIVPAMVKEGAPITLYVSSNDRALKLSKEIHNYPRAGDVPGVVKAIKGLELIDVSSVETDFLGHSYYGDGVSVISDIYYLLQGNRPSNRFHLTELPADGGSYWEFRK